MLREHFAGRNPTHYIASPVVKAFITSEIFLWGAWDAITPLIAIFVVRNIPHGDIQLAASAYSVYLVTRVIFELVSGRNVAKRPDEQKIVAGMFGLSLVSLACFGFAFADSLLILFGSFFIAGMGLGIASPAKNSLFSTHLDKNKESTEWSVYDGSVFICIALCTALAGFIATVYGFRILFLLAGFWIILSEVPYLVYLRKT